MFKKCFWKKNTYDIVKNITRRYVERDSVEIIMKIFTKIRKLTT